jgi:hypothetical protein
MGSQVFGYFDEGREIVGKGSSRGDCEVWRGIRDAEDARRGGGLHVAGKGSKDGTSNENLDLKGHGEEI